MPSSEAPGGEMDDMALDVPPPPADAAPDTAPEDDPMAGDPNAMGGEEPADPMAGDPNALSAGQGDDVSQKLQQLSPDQQDAAEKYIDSMLNDDEQAGGVPDMPQQPMESKFNFKHIIDEVFGEVEATRPLDQGTDRPGKTIEDSAVTEYQSPFTPGL
jgi:hypothetical protein